MYIDSKTPKTRVSLASGISRCSIVTPTTSPTAIPPAEMPNIGAANAGAAAVATMGTPVAITAPRKGLNR